MFAVDLHAHTRFFHGRRRLGNRFDPVGVRLLARAIDRRGLDGVATTNHDYYTQFASSDVTIIPGIEVSTTHGHVLVIGPDPPTETVPLEYTPTEVVELAHERNCAAIIAHPYRGSDLGDPRFADVPFDAIEINGKHPRTRPLVDAIAAERDLPIVAGSDAHVPLEAGRAWTLIDADELTPESVVTAIRDGRVAPRVANGRIDDLLRRGYRRLHERKYPDDVLARSTASIERRAETRVADRSLE